MLFVSLLALASTAFAAPAAVDTLATPFDGTKLVRVPTGSSNSSLVELQSLIDNLGLSSWTIVPTVNSHVDVTVPEGKFDEFMKSVETIISESGIQARQVGQAEVLDQDLGQSIRAEQEGMQNPVVDPTWGLAVPSFFNNFQFYDNHIRFLNDLVRAFPGNSRTITYGKSFEGRTITGIHIYGSSGPDKKPAVVWNGNAHAREWISSTTVEYLAYQLLTGYGQSEEVKKIVNSYDFYIFPIVNPDGFVYSQTFDRLWRKTRQPTGTFGNQCFGRDLNRNFDISFWQNSGTTSNPCAEDFRGFGPADAPETQGIAGFLDRRVKSRAGAKMFMDFGSYGPLIMIPYGYSCSVTRENNFELTSLARGYANAAWSVTGSRYVAGNICSTAYVMTGGAVDYASGIQNIPYSFAAVLGYGNYGYILPPSLIQPIVTETWAGVRYLLNNLR